MVVFFKMYSILYLSLFVKRRHYNFCFNILTQDSLSIKCYKFVFVIRKCTIQIYNKFWLRKSISCGIVSSVFIHSPVWRSTVTKIICSALHIFSNFHWGIQIRNKLVWIGSELALVWMITVIMWRCYVSIMIIVIMNIMMMKMMLVMADSNHGIDESY